MIRIVWKRKYTIKRLLLVLLIIITVMQMIKVMAQSEDELIEDPVLSGEKMTINPYEDILEYTYPDSETSYNDINLFEINSLPAKYDPRDTTTKGIAGWPIQNQGSEGNCWAFSAIASREAWWAKQTGTYPKFSEYHMSAAMYKNADNPWTYAHSRRSGGGNREMAAAYYSRGSGPISLEFFDGPDYTSYYKTEDTIENYNKYIKSITSKEQVTNAIFFNGVNGSYKISKINTDNDSSYNYYPASYDGSNISVIKQAILNYGAVMTAYCSTESGTLEPNIKRTDFFNKNSSSYCFCPSLTEVQKIAEGEILPNHAVTIVGWDDDYSWGNFSDLPSGIDGLPDEQSKMNGAWIVRNSWGIGSYLNAENGYEYISYYDFFIGINSVAFPGVMDRTDYINQYDGLYPNSAIYWNSNVNSISVKNSFETQDGNAELISAVGVFVPNANTTVALRIDNNITPNDNNNDAIKPSLKDKSDIEDVYVEDDSIFVKYPGFYILELDRPVSVNGSYEVILTCSVPSGNPINIAVLTNDVGSFASQDVINDGVSFYFNKMKWVTINNFHFTIKTYNNYIKDTAAIVDTPVYDNEKYTMNVEIVCPDEERFDGKTALVAVYDEYGNLCGLKEAVIDLSDGDVQNVEVEYTDACQYRVMIWDSLNDVIPVWATDAREDIPQIDLETGCP